MKAVQLLVESELPADLQDFNREYSAKNLGKLLTQMAERYPERYAELSKRLSDHGLQASYYQGETLRLRDFKPVIDRDTLFRAMDQEIDRARKEAVDEKDFERQRFEIWERYNGLLQKHTMEAALQQGNNLGYAILSGARGKAPQLQMMVSSPGLYQDSKGEVIPLFVRRSFGEGLRPAEYLAGTFGARSTVISTKRCLVKGTLVRMADGRTCPIEAIKAGEWVVGADKEGRMFPVRVVRTYHQGLQDAYRWYLKLGAKGKRLEVQATEDHKILATSIKSYARVRAARLRGTLSMNPRDVYHEKKIERIGAEEPRFAAVMPTSTYEHSGGVENPYAMLLGLLSGDGSCTLSRQGKGVRLLFSCADETLVEDLKPMLDRLGLKITPANRFNYDREINAVAYSRADHARQRVRKGLAGFQPVDRHPAKQAFLDSGLRGKYAHEKVLPPDFMTWDYASQDMYLAGLFASDGSFTRTGGSCPNGFHLYLTSRVLVEQVADVLLWRFGINAPARIKEVKTIKRNGVIQPRKHSLWGFHVSAHHEISKLARIFPLIPGKKGETARKHEGWQLKQQNPYIKAYVKRGESLGLQECFDLEVESEDHLFVLANGVIVSNSTAKGGYLAKLAVQAATPIMVTTQDCGTTNGIDLDLDDNSLRHRVLTQETAGIPAGTILDRHTISRLRKEKDLKNVVVRSAMTCQAKEGVCSKCLGADPRGKPYPVGYAAGITATQALFEPVTQNALNSKHTGGVVSGVRREYSGFNWLNQFVQAPEDFPERAVVAELDGKVDRVEQAPQGGQYVVVGNQQHYVPPGFDLLVKPGDTVEQGDQLSDGLVNPADIVRLRGVGEGRRFYADRLKKILDDSGLAADRRNTEVMARAAINHLNIDDLDDPTGALPDDVVSYDRYARDYEPPETAQTIDPTKAVGKILQRPALHYSVGTRITPKVASRLQSARINQVVVDDKGPAVTPTMIRLQSAMHNSPDWLASQHTSYLKRQLNEAAVRGQDTNVRENIHFVPRLAIGEDFGKNTYQSGKF